MTAPIDPDQNPHTRQNTDSVERPAFVYDDPSAQQNLQYEPEYVPEREFVLMPLFRRIGELLGIRRNEESEYIYEPEPETPPVTTTVAAKAELLDSQEFPAADMHEIPSVAAGPAAPSSQAPWEVLQQLDAVDQHDAQTFVEQAHSPAAQRVEDLHVVAEDAHANAALWAERGPEDVLGLTHEAESVAVPQQAQPEPEVTFQSKAADPAQSEVFTPVESWPEAEPIAKVSRQTAEPPEFVPTHAQQQNETTDLIASLREATARISAAIIQAAEWLHSKEEEILRRSETQVAQPKPRIEEPRHVENYARTASEAVNATQEASAEPLPQTWAPIVPKWEVYETPALQREMAWQDQPTGSSEAEAAHPNFARSERESEAHPTEGLRPKLVQTLPRRPFWQRVDWAQKFTPKRVAILGAAAMALALVAGISLAKRPASSELPQQSRALEPGGITVSTHPSAQAVSRPVPRPALPMHRTPQARPARRAAGDDDGPEVVTHYYNHKPSPIKQSTVAGGVRHYSDIQ